MMVMQQAGDSGMTSKITAVQQMFSSCSGALVTSITMTPLDVVKIRLQSQRQPLNRGQQFIYCNGLMEHMCTCTNGTNGKPLPWFSKPGHFSGTIDAFIKITRTEGLRSLWSGLPPTLVMAVPATVIYFTSYEQLKSFLKHKPWDHNDLWKPMVAGMVARVWAATVISPLELVRTQLQSSNFSYSMIGGFIKNEVSQRGLASLWRGLGPTLFRDVPFSGIYWFGYEAIKARILMKNMSTDIEFHETLISGATAGSIAAICTLPFDVIKTHRQITFGLHFPGCPETNMSSSTWSLIKQLYRSQGFQSLFAGLVPRLVKVAPACAIMISSYEYFKKKFLKRNERLSKNYKTS
ncbi:probable mitochondrial glutathione transporter SLC25A40 [Octopus bimaculoides]|uniref:Solute carrier family 25 member 40 n=1 Tax=Octopus bimaculoides TaxID=37653 RepID=A0A0L8H6E4_OCTBM|nr:probable mitochondrial glutathione transporter SLC25A40 [Octopus bimaculoides]|eukprot:XP_014775128.1 PREDICTED: solute carrier family 25 member 40-like [Octopus bimaculoides]